MAKVCFLFLCCWLIIIEHQFLAVEGSVELPSLSSSLTKEEGDTPYDVQFHNADVPLSSIRHRKLVRGQRPKHVIPGQYLVVLQDHVRSVDQLAQQLLQEAQGGIVASGTSGRLLVVKRSFHTLLKGFVVSNLYSSRILLRLLDSTDVIQVIQDERVQLEGGTTRALTQSVQSNPPNWGLDRIDQEALPGDSEYHYDYSGLGVEVYVMDTGIRATHTDFRDRNKKVFVSRVSCAKNFVTTEDCSDYEGHGTHVAGIVGGVQYGVAKDVTLKTVKVYDKTGGADFSVVLSAVEFIYGEKQNRPGQPMVVNMSLGGSNKPTGGRWVVVTVAAGNSQHDACNDSPGSAVNAITVASTDSNDARSSFSNYGACVDLFAPGGEIVSAYMTSDSASATLSGTSQSAPHVAGAAAQVLQLYKNFNAFQVQAKLLAAASLNHVFLPGANSPNMILNVIKPPPPTPAPSAHPSHHPSRRPSHKPSDRPSRHPSRRPSALPSSRPSHSSSPSQSVPPSGVPSDFPSSLPSSGPSESSLPSAAPSLPPSALPSGQPSSMPTASHMPSASAVPSGGPTATAAPSELPPPMGSCVASQRCQPFKSSKGGFWVHRVRRGGIFNRDECHHTCMPEWRIKLALSVAWTCGKCQSATSE